MRYEVRLANSNHYQAFDNYLWGKNAIIYLKPNATLEAVSHETGHYMNHLMSGYNRFMEIYGRMPKEYWGLGGSVEHVYGQHFPGRNILLEEYAYFSQFLATGTLDYWDLYNTNRNLNFSLAFDNPKDPSAKDYPSHEGFGVFLLASLMRDAASDKIYIFDGKTQTNVPSIGMHHSIIIQHFLQKGPMDITELFDKISSHLLSTSQDDYYKLPAMFEPLGWSYNGSGNVVDQEGQPVPACKVKNICQAGGKEYSTQETFTDDKGKFTLKRIFPGSTILRIFYNFQEGAYKDSSDFHITVDWKQETNKSVDLNQFVVETEEIDLLPILKMMKWVAISLITDNPQNAVLTYEVHRKGLRNLVKIDEKKDETWQGIYFGWSHYDYGNGSAIKWNGNSFSVSWEDKEYSEEYHDFTYYTYTITGTAGEKGKKFDSIRVVEVVEYEWEDYEGDEESVFGGTSTKEFLFKEIPLEWFQDHPNGKNVYYMFKTLGDIVTGMTLNINSEYDFYTENSTTGEVINDWKMTQTLKSLDLSGLQEAAVSVRIYD